MNFFFFRFFFFSDLPLLLPLLCSQGFFCLFKRLFCHVLHLTLHTFLRYIIRTLELPWLPI